MAKVLIIGIGGLGCPVAEALTRAGIGKIGIIDNDLVSLSNIHRQSLYDIKDLNTANINLLKSSFERKKFRHYYNHVVLRRLVSDDKKMLLRLENTKLNASQR